MTLKMTTNFLHLIEPGMYGTNSWRHNGES